MLVKREHVEILERELAEHKQATATTGFRSLRMFWRWCTDAQEASA